MPEELDPQLLFCYSKLYSAFIKELERRVKKILSLEMSITVARSRFTINSYSYPIKIILFEHPKKLGFFCPQTLVIGIHKEFMLSKNEVEIENLLRHELAHYYTHITSPNAQQVHGKEFRTTCKKFSWDKTVYLSTQRKSKALVKAKSIQLKIQKLIALSKSSNVFEAENSLRKAKALLEKYEINESGDNSEPEMVVKRVLQLKRASTLLNSICSILEEFFVIPVVSHTKSGVYLEVLGKLQHVQIAEYIANILLNKLPSLFKETNLKGATMANSFYIGLSKGFKESLQVKTTRCNAIIKVHTSLQEGLVLAYPRLKTSGRKVGFNPEASKLGFKKGKSMSIKKGVKDFTKQGLSLLKFLK